MSIFEPLEDFDFTGP